MFFTNDLNHDGSQNFQTKCKAIKLPKFVNVRIRKRASLRYIAMTLALAFWKLLAQTVTCQVHLLFNSR